MNSDERIKVSVTLLSYKHAKYIRQCLDSILAQKVNFRYEIIVGDDCSEDGTKEILLEYKEKYPEIFVLVLNEKNQGAARNAYNIAKLCRGEYISGGESDDYWIDEYRMQKEVDFLDTHPDYIAVFSNYVNVDHNGEHPYVSMLKWQVNKKYIMKDYLRYGMVLHGNTSMVRNVLPKGGEKYDKVRFTAPTMGDVILRLLIYDKGPVYCLPDVMHAHRMGSANSTSFFSNQRSKAIKFSYMYCSIIDALEEYFEGKYDLSVAKANRVGGVILNAIMGDYKIDKTEFKEFMNTLPKRIQLLSYERFLQKGIRAVGHKIGRKLKLFYKS